MAIYQYRLGFSIPPLTSPYYAMVIKSVTYKFGAHLKVIVFHSAENFLLAANYSHLPQLNAAEGDLAGDGTTDCLHYPSNARSNFPHCTQGTWF